MLSIPCLIDRVMTWCKFGQFICFDGFELVAITSRGVTCRCQCHLCCCDFAIASVFFGQYFHDFLSCSCVSLLHSLYDSIEIAGCILDAFRESCSNHVF